MNNSKKLIISWEVNSTSEATLTKITKLIAAIRTEPAGALVINLTPNDRVNVLKMGNKTLAFL